MKAIFTNYRYYVLTILVMAVIVLIFCDVDDTLPNYLWAYCLVTTKLLGIGLGWIIAKLVKRWERMGAVPELSNAKKNY